MLLYEWGVTSKAPGRPESGPVGVTDAALRAQALMLEALGAVPAGALARGWVTGLVLGADRLTYDRLATLARVSRDTDGALHWLAADVSDGDGRLPRLSGQTAVIDGRHLRELRRARGLSQEQLAWRAGVGVTTVARLERLIRPPCLGRTVARLAEVLGEHPRAMVTSLPPDRTLTHRQHA